MEVSVKKLMEVSWGSGKNRDTMIPPRFIEKLPLIHSGFCVWTGKFENARRDNDFVLSLYYPFGFGKKCGALRVRSKMGSIFTRASGCTARNW
jgi:hypothetical protein